MALSPIQFAGALLMDSNGNIPASLTMVEGEMQNIMVTIGLYRQLKAKQKAKLNCVGTFDADTFYPAYQGAPVGYQTWFFELATTYTGLPLSILSSRVKWDVPQPANTTSTTSDFSWRRTKRSSAASEFATPTN